MPQLWKYNLICRIEENMQDLEQLKFGQQINDTLNNSRLNDSNLDIVTLHCRRDHLSPSFHENTSNSCYKASYSPGKKHNNYNQPEMDKGIGHFRKYQNSTAMLPSLKVSEHSHYQSSFSGHSAEKDPKGVEKGSHFLKMNWALDPTSNYKVRIQLNSERFQRKRRF